MSPVDAVETFPSSRFLSVHEAAFTLVAALFVTPAVVLVVRAMRDVTSPFEKIASALAADRRAVPVLAAAVSLAGSAFVSFALVDKTVIIDDERAYLFEANLFLHGRVGEPAVLAAFRNQMFITQPVHAAKYFPGNSALLALGEIVHAPYIVDPILAAATCLCVYAFMFDAFGKKHAMLAAALFALSPFVWCVDGTLMAFGPTAAMIAAMLAGLARATKAQTAFPAALAGVALGAAFVTRPFDAVLLGTPAFAWLGWQTYRRRVRLVVLASFAAGGLSLAWIAPWFNHALTGSIWTSGYSLEANPIHLGFVRAFAGPYRHTFANGVAGDATILLRLDSWLWGAPGALLIIGCGVARPSVPFDWLLRAMLATFLIVFVIVPATGTWDVGPTYGFVLVPILVAVATRGVQWMARVAPAATPWAVCAFVAFGLVTMTPLRFARLAELCAQIRAPWEAIAQSHAKGLVVVPGIRARAAAGWAYGHPFTIETKGGTATLITPRSRRDYDEAVSALHDSSALVLTLDVRHFIATKDRVFVLAPFDPKTLDE
jgi:hypothetical protein